MRSASLKLSNIPPVSGSWQDDGPGTPLHSTSYTGPAVACQFAIHNSCLRSLMSTLGRQLARDRLARQAGCSFAPFDMQRRIAGFVFGVTAYGSTASAQQRDTTRADSTKRGVATSTRARSAQLHRFARRRTTARRERLLDEVRINEPDAQEVNSISSQWMR